MVKRMYIELIRLFVPQRQTYVVYLVFRLWSTTIRDIR